MDDTRMHVLNNIFLPRKLPQSAFPSRGEFVREFAQVLAEEVLDFHALEEAERMMRIWSGVQGASISWELVHYDINKLLPGETYPLYLGAQNAGLTISIDDEPGNTPASATLAVFRVAAGARVVMQASGDLSDVFPSWAATTDARRVRNESFAKQVADLANTGFVEMLSKSRKAGRRVPETRDVSDPSYVTEWLMMAVAGRSLITGEGGVVRVRKKIRDDVLWKDAELPWRRSGEYMTVKCVLHSTLVGDLGEHEGLLSYKYILIQVMTRILRQNHKKLDTDVVLQMLSKLARRLSKLRNLMNQGAELSGTGRITRPGVLSHIDKALERCSMTMVSIGASDRERWDRIVEREKLRSRVVVDTSKFDFAKHITQSLKTARQHLQLALNSSRQSIRIEVKDPIGPNRNIGCSFPNVDYLVNQGFANDIEVEKGQALYDIEVWVQQVLWQGREESVENWSFRMVEKVLRKCLNVAKGYDRDDAEGSSRVYQALLRGLEESAEGWTSEMVFKVLREYIGLARGYYKTDAVGLSRMIITAYSLVAILDFLATRRYSLLLTYNHGVNVSVLQSLLLVHRADMEHLAILEAYFAARSAGVSDVRRNVSLISEDEPSPESFSVRFVDESPQLQKMRYEILEVTRAREREKLKEVSIQREIHAKLVQSISTLSHEYYEDRYNNQRHSNNCTKCGLEEQAKNMRVGIYERPLPEEIYLQKAVVYELATPTELSVLRDALHVLNRDVLGIQLGSQSKRGTWLKYEPLQHWIPPQEYEKLTTLCSTSKLFAVSHYSSLHPSASDLEFIKPNGFNVHLMEAGDDRSASTACYTTEPNISSLTLTVDGVYACLQWTIASTTHDENQVLARQVQCPPKLDLAEFKAFGSLRAGHRLQIRNISRALEMRTLTLYQPSVVNLLSQALWQTGPATSGGRSEEWVRESHLDLHEQRYAEHMVQQLRTLLDRNRENWKDHLGLLSVVIIGARIVALCEAAWQEAACRVLLSCRAVAESWLEKIEQVLGEMSASSVEKIQAIRSKLVDVAAIAALTFDVGMRNLRLVIRSQSDVTSWLRAVARIRDNTLLESFGGLFQRNLLRRVRSTALRLEIALHEWILKSDCLSNFAMQHWADADQGQIGCWDCYERPCRHWWKATFEHRSGRKMTLQMDILRGSFLVDGRPVARLPATITSHPDYGRVFGKHVFQVQPAAGSPGSFVTCHRVNGSKFTFALVDDNRLLVTERRSDGRELELFPSRFLNGDLPQLLIEAHSHWILTASNCTRDAELTPFKHMDPAETVGCILFRPVKFDDGGFGDIEGVPFVLNIGSRRVRDTQTDRSLIDVRSPSFQELYCRVLHRLELPQFVHVFDNKKDGTVAAELPRMGLRFNVDPETGLFWSCEHPGYSVSAEQNVGTLIGLRNGILLEEHAEPPQCTQKHSLIIPHSAQGLVVNMEDCGTLARHPVVKINLTEFSSPSFFVFEVDHRLQILRGPASGPTAWLYLALLHAVTSHMFPDPFTGLTGTESAMRLLQSPRCWSCMPYKDEASFILKSIARLSPRREWYPPNLQCMQTVTWPQASFPSTALDAFRLVVGKLVSDSERLRVLFPGSAQAPVLPEANSTLLLKHYWRSRETFGKEAQMDSANEEHFGGPPAPSSARMNLSQEEYGTFQGLVFLRSLAEAGHERRNLAVGREENVLLSDLLLRCAELKGATGGERLRDSTVSTWRTLAEGSFADSFLDLYNLARAVPTRFSSLGLQEQHNRREAFTLLLSVLAYLSVDPPILSLLHRVAVHASEFEDLVPPKYATFQLTMQARFDMAMVTSVVKDNSVSFEDWIATNGGSPRYNESSADWRSRLRRAFDRDQAQSIRTMTENAQRRWPNDVRRVSTSGFLRDSVTSGINELFTRWRQNIKLHAFVTDLGSKVAQLRYEPGVTMEPAPLQPAVISRTSTTSQTFHSEMPISSLSSLTLAEADEIFRSGQFGIRSSDHRASAGENQAPPTFPLQQDAALSSCGIATKFSTDLQRSWAQHHRLQPHSPRDVDVPQLEDKLRVSRERSKSLWTEICVAVQPCGRDYVSQALEAAGLWHRALPTVLLPCLVSGGRPSAEGLENVRVGLGALAVLWTLEQQVERCLRILQSTKSPNEDVALQKELANTGHLNWQPKERPQWLLLELEGDYLMRAIQVDVAKQMLLPAGAENAVLQLNMGEGKTSVIVPALCACIPDGEHFARLTVLGSLFRMNFDALVSKLGGLLGQRVYTFPYRRDISIDARGVQAMHTVYQECIAKRGVVVMRPEHRLSTILKGLELCRFGTTTAGLAAEMRSLQGTVEKKAKDILDESDLLLHVKYQVVYTVGEQMNLDGGDLRWKVSQSVLRSAQRHCNTLLQTHGAEKIEMRAAPEGPYAFPHVRILDASISGELCEKIADDILQGGDDNLPLRELRRNDAALIRSFILPSTGTVVAMEAIQEIYNEGPVLETILILRGLLCYGVLLHALQLRWRVQYGVRPSGVPKMAVPFRAKDVPVERAEFGHPDLAIILTALSYYHGGLSDAQLLEAFDRLHRSSTSESEYQRWLQAVPLATLPPTLHTLSGVNLDDYAQRTEVLFPVLRRNMQVVNFWLSTAVFPIEAKMFEGKLVASAWDLSDSSQQGHPVSGFSGTKDTSLLLPASITQHDLPELQGTDGGVIAKLLQGENTCYESFPSCISSTEILDRSVVAKGARVLLDVGALMVDMSNKDVAVEWLKKLIDRSQIQAAIYFDDDNQIMSIDREGRSVPLGLSPFHRQMDRCVVYLDDVHTRGTDLKIPHGSHACVTLGRGITKDQLVQACMRMRMLGEGHSVSFWACQEVHRSITHEQSWSSDHEVTSIDVLHWAIRNTVAAIKDGFRHWCSQGIAHARKKVVSHMYESKQGVSSLQELGILTTDPEVTELAMSYGGERRESLLPQIMESRLKSAAHGMEAKIGHGAGGLVASHGSCVTNRIRKYAGKVKCFSQVLDEEQERELEHELEEEEEVQRPGTATPRKPSLSANVRLLATRGTFNPDSNSDFLPVMEALRGTSAWKLVECGAWSDKLFVTREFATVLAPESASSGVPFLRPVAWCAVASSSSKKGRSMKAIVLLSPFEANELLPAFRIGGGAELHMIAPRVHPGQDLMVCERALTLPTSGSCGGEPLPGSVIAELLAFSGSAFFGNAVEQDAYCEFLGLCPRPRSRVEDDAFQRGEIQLDGFFPPEKRRSSEAHGCGFQKSPVLFMAKLLSARGWTGHASASHVGQILFIGQRARI